MDQGPSGLYVSLPIRPIILFGHGHSKQFIYALPAFRMVPPESMKRLPIPASPSAFGHLPTDQINEHSGYHHSTSFTSFAISSILATRFFSNAFYISTSSTVPSKSAPS